MEISLPKREIKFKAWDNKNKCWLTDKDIVYLNEEGEASILVRGAASDYMSSVNVVTVFYTGLKDKNGRGVEIYEGDIVSIKEHFLLAGDSPLTNQIMAVSFEQGHFIVSNNKYLSSLNRLREFVEVIGNIYENHELLNPTV